MNRYNRNGIKIAYDDVGTGYPIVLLHGFAADSRLNWKLTGWHRRLEYAGNRVIAPDNRGHGRRLFLRRYHGLSRPRLAE